MTLIRSTRADTGDLDSSASFAMRLMRPVAVIDETSETRPKSM